MKKLVFLAIPVFLLLVGIGMQYPAIDASNAAQECSNFSVKDGDQVFFGSNDDMAPHIVARADATIMMYPANSNGNGYAEFGYFSQKGRLWWGIGGLNDKGLAYGTMTIPPLTLRHHSEKPIKGLDGFRKAAMRNASSVKEVIEIALQTDFSEIGNTMDFQLQFADATGNSVVIGPGLDGELVFTRKSASQPYLVSTNFNSGVSNEKNMDTVNAYERYVTAVSLVQHHLDEKNLSEMSARKVLEAVHMEGYGSYTASSRVYDLRNRDIYLYHYAQFDDGVKLNLADELNKGRHQIRVRDLFPQEVVTRGETRYQMVRVREMVTMGFLFAAALAFIVLLITWFVLRLRGRATSRRNPATRRRLSIGMGISWAVLCWSLLLFIVNSYPPNLIQPLLPMYVKLLMGPIGAVGIMVTVRDIIGLRKK